MEQLCEERSEESGGRRGGKREGQRAAHPAPAAGDLSHLGHRSPAEVPHIVKHRGASLLCLFEFLALICEIA